jgi:hypothetical protein
MSKKYIRQCADRSPRCEPESPEVRLAAHLGRMIGTYLAKKRAEYSSSTAAICQARKSNL